MPLIACVVCEIDGCQTRTGLCEEVTDLEPWIRSLSSSGWRFVVDRVNVDNRMTDRLRGCYCPDHADRAQRH